MTGLTASDRQVIRETWEVVGNKTVIRDRGVDLLIGLFEAHPYMQSYFKDFKDKSIAELKTSPKLRSHAIRTMNGLNQYMLLLDNPSSLAEQIKKLSETHLPRGIGSLEMDRLVVVFLGYMKQYVGDKWTDDAVAAWTQLLKVHNLVYKQQEDEKSTKN